MNSVYLNISVADLVGATLVKGHHGDGGSLYFRSIFIISEICYKRPCFIFDRNMRIVLNYNDDSMEIFLLKRYVKITLSATVFREQL